MDLGTVCKMEKMQHVFPQNTERVFLKSGEDSAKKRGIQRSQRKPKPSRRKKEWQQKKL
jgi:hypothetical protein